MAPSSLPVLWTSWETKLGLVAGSSFSVSNDPVGGCGLVSESLDLWTEPCDSADLPNGPG